MTPEKLGGQGGGFLSAAWDLVPVDLHGRKSWESTVGDSRNRGCCGKQKRTDKGRAKNMFELCHIFGKSQSESGQNLWVVPAAMAAKRFASTH